MNILFVCTGNTCRSPMAAAMMNRIAEENELDVHCESAGIFAETGAGATPEAAEALAKLDIDISAHRAQGISPEFLDKSDLILTMTQSHKMMLTIAADKPVYTLGEYGGSGDDVPDPYGGGIDDYRYCCNQLNELLLDALERVYDEYFKDEEEK